MTTATIIEDKNEAGVFRVEAIVDDGACEVAIFSGANALERATSFAASDYYDEWSDGTNTNAALKMLFEQLKDCGP